MLITNKLQEGDFSKTERALVDYILNQKMAIREMTMKEIAAQVHAAPSTLSRIAHKMNYPSWNELKTALLKEEEYLGSHICNVDANIPFKKNDSIVTIADRLAALKKEAIEETRKLLDYNELKNAVRLLSNASRIHIFAVSNNLLTAREFQHNMARIGREVIVHSLQGEGHFEAYLIKPDACALFISYTGESKYLIRIAQMLSARKIPMVMITSIGENTISRKCDCILQICTREKMYSKIATFSNDAGFFYILDLLYSCIFAQNYEKNLELRINTSKFAEEERSSKVEIIKE